MKTPLLVGYMGCGKSTLGRKLARRLGVGFVDTDALVEEQEGASVADVFRYEGEARFPEAEREALERATPQAAKRWSDGGLRAGQIASRPEPGAGNALCRGRCRGLAGSVQRRGQAKPGRARNSSGRIWVVDRA